MLLRGVGSPGAAQTLEALGTPLLGTPLPVRIRLWDGSEAGPQDGPVLLVKRRRALRRLLFHPGELGLAQAYVTGEIDLEGDLLEGLRQVWATAKERSTPAPRPPLRSLVRSAVRLGVLGPPPRRPASQARVRGRVHSLLRDRAVISHHYDLSNDFYRLILDPRMVYSCGYHASTQVSLQQAQRDKLELVAAKLAMTPGGRHLDVGCGWGALALHAAQHHGMRVLGVTLSREQKAFIDARVAELGLQHLVEIRLQDYREVPDTGFDSVSSLEMGEHVGEQNYPAFLSRLHAKVRDGGRVLIQQMSRRDRPGGGPFIESFIAPDMHMRPLGQTVALIEAHGFEVVDVQGLREHYALTIRAWYETFQENYPTAVALVGEEMARVWKLYLVGGALAFEQGRMGVDQILAVKPHQDGGCGMPLLPIW